MARLRLRFDAACELPGNSTHGLLQWWYALPPNTNTVADVAAGIISFFRLHQSCPNGVILLMDDFALPPSQRASLLNDKDLISVKPVPQASDPRTQHQRESLKKVLRRAALEEFEKELGGYMSEDEELNASNDQSLLSLSLENVLPEPSSVVRKKRKRVPEKSKVKKLKSRETVEKEIAAKAEKKKKKKKAHKEDDEDRKRRKVEEKLVDEEEETSSDDDLPINTDGTKVVEKPAEEDSLKRPSRSSRRKKAKRAWQKAMKDSSGNNTSEKKSEPTPSAAKEASTPVAPVVVAPGHIRFEPLEQSEQPVIVTTVNFGNGLLKSKKQGLSWGQHKRSGRVQEEEPLVEIGAVEHEEPAVDLDKLPLLQDTPKEGDILAYKLVELSASGCPEVSMFRVGKVAGYEASSTVIKLVTVPDHPVPMNEANEFPEPYQEDGTLEVEFSLLMDARVLHQAPGEREAMEKAQEPAANAEEKPVATQAEQQDAPLPKSKAEKWQVRSMRAAALGPVLARLRETST